MILDLIDDLGAWAWWIGGLVLLGLEILAPGNVFVWFGVAAIVVGAGALLLDPSWQTEFIAFAILALVLVVGGRRFFAGRSEAGEEPLLNERATRLVGRIFVLGEPIVEGTGRIKIDDSNWRIAGPDAPSGTRIRVTGADGSVLSVTRADG